MKEQHSNKFIPLTGLLILFAVVTLVYANHFDNGFHFDDAHTIEQNAFIRDIGNIPSFFTDATTFSSLPLNQSYRPVVSATLAIDYWLGGGLDPFYFHLSTFLLYLLQGALMFFLFRLIISKVLAHAANDWIALFITALYLLHTVNAETINYIISRSDTLSTLGVVAALYIYARNGWGKRFFLYLIPLLLGILAKPTAAVFLPLLFLYHLYFEQQQSLISLFKKDALPKWGAAVKAILPALIVTGAGALLVQAMTPATWTAGGTSRMAYLITQPWVMLHYFQMFFWPTQLSADTDWKVLPSVWDIRFFIGTAFVLLLLVLSVYTSAKAKWRPLSFGLLWFFLTLLPTSSFIPLAEVLNDHRMFFPFVGLALSVGYALSLLFIYLEKSLSKTTLAGVASVFSILILGAFSYGTYQRNQVWQDEESLWYDVTIKSPENGRGLMNYGLTQMKKKQYDRALHYFQQAQKLLPDYPYLHINLGILYGAMLQDGKAETHFKKAVQSAPDLPEAHYYYADWLLQRNQPEEAAFFLQAALKLSPAHIPARYLLMLVLNQLGQTEALEKVATETLNILPGDKLATNYLAVIKGELPNSLEFFAQYAETKQSPETFLELSLQYYNAGRYEDCIVAARKALELKPDYALAWNNICSAYNALQQWQQAMNACQKALDIEPGFERALNNLMFSKSKMAVTTN